MTRRTSHAPDLFSPPLARHRRRGRRHLRTAGEPAILPAWFPQVVVLVAYGLAFYLLSLTLKTLPVGGVAYAVWSGLGSVIHRAVIGRGRLRPEARPFAAVIGIGLSPRGASWCCTSFRRSLTAPAGSNRGHARSRATGSGTPSEKTSTIALGEAAAELSGCGLRRGKIRAGDAGFAHEIDPTPRIRSQRDPRGRSAREEPGDRKATKSAQAAKDRSGPRHHRRPAGADVGAGPG